MTYYNRKYKRFNVGNMEYLGSGEFGKVSHNKDIILKEYFSRVSPEWRISLDLFDILKTIDNPHFIKLFDVYTELKFFDVLKAIVNSSKFYVDAYTAKYYADNSVNVLWESKDYLLDNFRELELLFEIFSKNKIRTCDVKLSNSIVGKDGIVIIDPDFFVITDMGKELNSW